MRLLTITALLLSLSTVLVAGDAPTDSASAQRHEHLRAYLRDHPEAREKLKEWLKDHWLKDHPDARGNIKEWLRNHPEAREQLRQRVRAYLEQHPEVRERLREGRQSRRE